jgi:hypothetical protein
MSNLLLCAGISGVRDRFLMLSDLKGFADVRGYSVSILWGLTSSVAFCRFEELFAPIQGVTVINISPLELAKVAESGRSEKNIRVANRLLQVFRPGEVPKGDFFSSDLKSAGTLARMISRRPPRIVAKPSAMIRAQADAYARTHHMAGRLGIRVRVEENLRQKRKPHRVRKELDEVVQSIIRIPWYTRVFVATDSEYVQQMLSSHFTDSRFLPKNFANQEATGRYVHREDKNDMFTFVKEVDCLCRCERVINIGGFLNDHSVRQKWISEPYHDVACMHLVRR